MFATLAPGAGTIPPTPGRETDGGTAERGYLHCGPNGAGHFVKMIHNGIEYGLMAAYAEGLNILKKANVGSARLRQRRPIRCRFGIPSTISTISTWPTSPSSGGAAASSSSWLLDLTAASLAQSPELDQFSGRVSDSGEGRWTLTAANDEAVPAYVLTAALFARFASRGEDDFQNRVLSAMRLAFGGHLEKK